jgi:hypothetical protein
MQFRIFFRPNSYKKTEILKYVKVLYYIPIVLWVWNVVSQHKEGRMQILGIWEQRVEENVLM